MLAWCTYNQCNGGRKNCLIQIKVYHKIYADNYPTYLIIPKSVKILKSHVKSHIGRTFIINGLHNYGQNIRLVKKNKNIKLI